MTALLLSLITVLSASAGGLCAFRLHERRHLVLGFTAGALLGVVCFDLLPELLELSRQVGTDGRTAMAALAVGFVLPQGIDAVRHAAGAARGCPHRRPWLAMTAAAMVGHSFADGLGIGLAFRFSPAVGLPVAIAVIAHDFCDGLNLVSVALMQGSSHARTRRLVALNAVAPVLGALCSAAFEVPAQMLVCVLGLFAGLLLRIGLSHVLPRAVAGAGLAGAVHAVGTMLLGAASMLFVANLSR